MQVKWSILEPAKTWETVPKKKTAKDGSSQTNGGIPILNSDDVDDNGVHSLASRLKTQLLELSNLAARRICVDWQCTLCCALLYWTVLISKCVARSYMCT